MADRSWKSRAFGAGLSLLYFFANAVFLHAAETNLWTDRRRQTQRPIVQLASLPAPAQDFQSLPPATPRPLNALSPSLSESLTEGSSPEAARRIKAFLQSLPRRYGSIRSIDWSGKGIPSRIVLHIQDVHENAEAQENIAGTIEALAADAGPSRAGLIALEGAFGPLDLTPYRDFPDKLAVRHVADYLLRQNDISGPIHAALVSASAPPPLVGVDHPAHYAANVEAYKRSVDSTPLRRADLAARRRALALRKAAAFNPALRDFDARSEAYGQGKLPLGDYIAVLAAGAPSLPADVRTFQSSLAMERSLDFKAVEKERSALIEALAQKLSPADLRDLVARSASYRLGETGPGDYYKSLEALCERSGLPLSRFPSMDAYVRYVLLSETISASRLFDDVQALEGGGYDRRTKTEEERGLARFSRYLGLAGKLIDFALTPDEWGEYQRLRDGLKAGPEAPLTLDTFESFYVEARARDRAMTDNLLKAMEESSASNAVLVTGGFHARGMREYLKAAGVAVVEFVPTLTHVDAAEGSSYLSVFTQEKTPLEKIFQGEKLFVSKHPAERGLAKALALLPLEMGLHAQDPSAVLKGADALPGRPQFKSVEIHDASALATVVSRKSRGAVKTTVLHDADGIKDVAQTPAFDPASAMVYAALALTAVVSIGSSFLRRSLSPLLESARLFSLSMAYAAVRLFRRPSAGPLLARAENQTRKVRGMAASRPSLFTKLLFSVALAVAVATGCGARTGLDLWQNTGTEDGRAGTGGEMAGRGGFSGMSGTPGKGGAAPAGAAGISGTGGILTDGGMDGGAAGMGEEDASTAGGKSGQAGSAGAAGTAGTSGTDAGADICPLDQSLQLDSKPGFPLQVGFSRYPAGNHVRPLKLADIKGDGRFEVFAGGSVNDSSGWTGKLQEFDEQGRSSWQADTWNAPYGASVTQLDMATFQENGVRKQTLVYTYFKADIGETPGGMGARDSATGVVQWEKNIAGELDEPSLGMTLSDLDADGIPEIITPYGKAFRVNGDTLVPGVFPSSFMQESPAVADVTGDGVPEILQHEGGSNNLESNQKSIYAETTADQMLSGFPVAIPKSAADDDILPEETRTMLWADGRRVIVQPYFDSHAPDYKSGDLKVAFVDAQGNAVINPVTIESFKGYIAGSGYQDVESVVADVDGDGRNDLVLFRQNPGSLTLFALNDQGRPLSGFEDGLVVGDSGYLNAPSVAGPERGFSRPVIFLAVGNQIIGVDGTAKIIFCHAVDGVTSSPPVVEKEAEGPVLAVMTSNPDAVQYFNVSGRLTASAPDGGLDPSLWKRLEPYFRWPGGKFLQRVVAQPLIEELYGAHRIQKAGWTNYLPLGHSLVPILLAGLLNLAGAHPLLTQGAFIASLIGFKAWFVDRHPSGERFWPVVIAFLSLVVAGPVLLGQNFSPEPLAALLLKMAGVHVGTNLLAPALSRTAEAWTSVLERAARLLAARAPRLGRSPWGRALLMTGSMALAACGARTGLDVWPVNGAGRQTRAAGARGMAPFLVFPGRRTRDHLLNPVRRWLNALRGLWRGLRNPRASSRLPASPGFKSAAAALLAASALQVPGTALSAERAARLTEQLLYVSRENERGEPVDKSLLGLLRTIDEWPEGRADLERAVTALKRSPEGAGMKDVSPAQADQALQKMLVQSEGRSIAQSQEEARRGALESGKVPVGALAVTADTLGSVSALLDVYKDGRGVLVLAVTDAKLLKDVERLRAEHPSTRAFTRLQAGLLDPESSEDGLIRVDMGRVDKDLKDLIREDALLLAEIARQSGRSPSEPGAIALFLGLPPGLQLDWSRLDMKDALVQQAATFIMDLLKTMPAAAMHLDVIGRAAQIAAVQA